MWMIHTCGAYLTGWVYYDGPGGVFLSKSRSVNESKNIRCCCWWFPSATVLLRLFHKRPPNSDIYRLDKSVHVRLGALVSACYTFDNKWYRARIIALFSKGKCRFYASIVFGNSCNIRGLQCQSRWVCCRRHKVPFATDVPSTSLLISCSVVQSRQWFSGSWVKWFNKCQWVTWVRGQCRKTLDPWLGEV